MGARGGGIESEIGRSKTLLLQVVAWSVELWGLRARDFYFFLIFVFPVVSAPRIWKVALVLVRA